MAQTTPQQNNTNMYLIGGLVLAIYLYATTRTKLKNIGETVIEPSVDLGKVSNPDRLLQAAATIKKALSIYIWQDVDTDTIIRELKIAKNDYDIQYIVSAIGQVDGPLTYSGDFFEAVNTFPSITASERRKIAKELKSFAYKIND